MVVIDAFNSDAIPVHLITREAFQLYLRRVGPHGVILFHISNRYVRLEPVLASLAKDAGLVCRAQRYDPGPSEEHVGPSRWAVLARTDQDLGRVAADRRWHTCQYDGSRVWTDDYSDLIGAMNFG